MHDRTQTLEICGPPRGEAPAKRRKPPSREDRVQARELMPSRVRHDRPAVMRLHLEEIEQLCMPHDDLEQKTLVRNELDHDELRDEVLPRHTERLADDAPLAQQSGRFEHG